MGLVLAASAVQSIFSGINNCFFECLEKSFGSNYTSLLGKVCGTLPTPPQLTIWYGAVRKSTSQSFKS